MRRLMFTFLTLLAALTVLADELPQTPMPVITVEELTDYVIISASGEGEVKLYVDGELMPNPCEWYRDQEDQYIEVTATAKLRGYAISDLAVVEYVVEGIPPSPEPMITINELDTCVIVYADGYGGYVEMSINGELVDNPCVWPRTEEEQQIIVYAFCILDGCQPSQGITMEYTVAPLPQTPAPVITITEEMDCVVIEAEGEGTVTMYINGEEVCNPITWCRSDMEQDLVIVATAKRDGYLISDETVFEYCVVPFPLLPPPLITFELTDEAGIIYVEGEGEIMLFVNDEPVCEYPYVIARGTEDQEIEVYATATAAYALPSESDRYTFVVPALETTEMAEAPSISVEIEQGLTPQAWVTITSAEEGSEIYYRVSQFGEEWTEWMKYDMCPIWFNQEGDYTVQAFAEAPDRLRSEVVSLSFHLVKTTGNYDFEVDGVYYKQLGNNKAGVVAHGEDPQGYQGDIVIPNQVTYEGVTYNVTEVLPSAFEDCTGMSSVTIGNYVTTIGDQAFMGCTGLTEVILGDYVISVGDRAFLGCTSLLRLTIGHGLRTLGYSAFAGCNSLETIICKPAVPPVMSDSGCFSCYSTATLKVYPAVLESYQNNSSWNRFTNIVGEDTVNPEVNDVDGDGQFNITDITTLIDRLLND